MTTTIQETDKTLKLQIVLATIWIMVGVIGFFVTSQPTIPLIIIATGVGWYLLTIFLIWWHHK